MNSVRPDSCAGCRHFNGRPLDIEAALPGLSSLSSAYAAVRSNDGICAVHDRYVAATSVCAAYAAAADTEAVTDTEALKELGPLPGNRKTSARAPYR
jgi:hypothetical protein